MSNTLNLVQSITCPVCENILSDPVSLSCGYTICSHCFPISSPNSIKKSVFKCPVKTCEAATHIFAPQLASDAIMDQIIQLSAISEQSSICDSILSLLNCQGCGSTVSDPVTTPCGHTFCRLCVLQSKIDSDTCITCYSPLPKYSVLLSQPANQSITTVLTSFGLNTLRDTVLLDAHHLEQHNVPLFVSNSVILPGQSSKIAIFQPNHLRMFRNALIPSRRYNNLCLASVHRVQPNVAQFGTLLQISGIEHRTDAILIDVTGLDRFELSTHQEVDETAINGHFRILDESAVPMFSIDVVNDVQYVNSLAEHLVEYIKHLGSTSDLPVGSIHSQTAGLLGPNWLLQKTTQLGPVPSNPIDICWWAAMALPGTNDLYSLLRTVPIVDRLELVLGWIEGLTSNWEKCRYTALNALNQLPIQQN